MLANTLAAAARQTFAHAPICQTQNNFYVVSAWCAFLQSFMQTVISCPAMLSFYRGHIDGFRRVRISV